MRKRILVVDNDRCSRQELRHILSDEYDIVEATGGQVAKEGFSASDRAASAAILAGAVPDGGYKEIIAHIRGEYKTRTPVLMAMEERDCDMEDSLLSMGACDFVLGSYTAKYLKNRLSNLIGAHPLPPEGDAPITADASEGGAPESSPAAGALDEAAFAQGMERIIAGARLSHHTLLIVDVDGVESLREAFGKAAGDQALADAESAIRSLLRHGDLLGRAGDARFLIFMRDVPYDSVIENKARQVCSQVRKMFSREVRIAANIGIAVYPRDGESFSTLQEKSNLALAAVKGGKQDNYSFYRAELDTGPAMDGPEKSDGAPSRVSSTVITRRILIVDDDEINLRILRKIFENKYRVDTVKDGKTALARLHHSGRGYSVVLLDLMMPGMDGFAVMEKMRESVELQSIPVIVVSGENDREITLRAIKFGAADFVNKPVDADLIRLRVESAISKAENERLRAQNSYLLLQSSEEAKYRTVLDSTGTVVIEYEWASGIFIYDHSISEHIAGNYDERRLWHIFMSDMVADAMDVKAMQELVYSIANDRAHEDGEMLVMLKTPAGPKQWFRMRVYKRVDEYQLTNKLIITYVNINDEVLTEEKLRYQAERDELTGLYSRATFFEKAGEMIAAHEPGYYVMTGYDINNFKVVNDQYGTAKGDEVLRQIAEVFKGEFESAGGIAGRISADNFVNMYPASFLSTGKLEKIANAASVLDGSILPLSYSIGRYLVDDLSLSPSAMYDRAELAKASVKGRYDVHVGWYDESMRSRLILEQSIVTEMKPALTESQFEVWFQPQYNHSSGALIGAEALVRWRHPGKGIIVPGEFIPVFERNGFIYELDKYVWEQSCVMLRKWSAEGRSPLPVSVNVSRYDLFRDDLFDVLSGLLRRYGLPVELLRLEITESAFSQSTEQIINTVKKLVELGFTVEIDDFGSGYSSLNTLKSVPAQIVKMDMRFLESDDDSDRGGSILESVVRMSKWLGMSVIAEGVETKEQADFLKSIGCNYVQGYLYGKPMPATEYGTLVSSIRREEKLLTMETVENLDNNAFWNPKSMDTLIFNTYVGGACIFEWYNDRIEILRANEKYAKAIGGESCTVEDALNLKWEEHMDEAAAKATRAAIEQAIATGDDVSYEAVYHDLFGNKGKTWLRTTFRAIARSTGRYLLYATNENLSAQRTAEMQKNRALEQLRIIMDNISGGVTAVVMDNGAPKILFANEQFYAMLGFTKEQFDAEVENAHSLTHPDDRERIVKETEEASRTQQAFSTVYRVLLRDGSIRWWQSNITIIKMPESGVPVQLSVANDVTALRQAEQRERETAGRMQAIMENAGSGITAVILKDNAVEFLFANDYYYALNGYTKEQFEAEVRDVYALAHPEDRQWVREAIRNANELDKTTPIEYRLIRRDGREIWVRTIISTRMIEGSDHPVQFSISTDITAEKLAEENMRESAEQLRFLNDTAGDLLLSSNAEGGINSVLEKVREYFGADRAYIFEYDYDQGLCSNSYEVCKPDIPSNAVKYPRFPLEMAKDWLQAFETSRFYYMEDVNSLGENRAAQRQVFDSLGVKSTLAVSLRTEGVVIGTMGVFNPTLHLANYDNLTAVGDYMAVILTRRDLNARIASDAENLWNMMNDAPGGFARLRVMPDGSLSAEYVNEKYCLMRGMTYAEIMRPDQDNSHNNVHPDDRDLTRSAVADLISTGETRNFQYRLKRGDGTYFPVNAFGRVSKNGAGETFINVYYTDLSEQEKREFSERETMPFILSAIMRSSADLSYAKDRNFRYICCSPAFVKLARQKTERDVIGKTDYDLWSQEEADHFRQEDIRLFESGEPLVDYIEEMPSTDGARHYCRTSKYILRDSTGEIIGLYGAGRDVTQERTAYEQLKFLTNSIPGGLATYEISPDGIRITYFNDGFCNMMGYTREEYAEISSTGVTNITFAEDIPDLMARIQALRRDGTPLECTYRIHTKDGGFKWVNSRSNKTEQRGDTCYVNVVLFDVTEAKLSEEASRIHDQEMRLAIAQMGKMLCEYDPVTRVLTLPEAYAAQYHVPATMPNVPESVLAAGFVDPSTAGVYREFYEAILRGENNGSAEYLAQRADGEHRWERVEFSMIYDSKGDPAKAIITVEDTTERHQQYELEQSRPSMGEENLIVHALFNLTTGETLEYVYRDGSVVPADDRTALEYGRTLIETLLIDEEEREQYRKLNDPAELIKRFNNGETELSLDYRRRVPSGDIIWVRNIKRMVCEPGGDDVLLFDYFYNVEEEKTQEQMKDALLNEHYEYVTRIYGENRRFVVMISENVRDGLIPAKGDDFDVFAAAIVNARVHPDDREMVLKNVLVEGIKKNLAASGRFQFTLRVKPPDSNEIQYKRITQYYLDRQRDIIIFARENVTELMREEARKAELLEAALAAANEETRVKEREANQRLTAIMNNVNGGMTAATLVDGKINYLHINDQYYTMLGYTQEQFEQELKRGIFDLIHPDDLPTVYMTVETSEKTGSAQMEFRAYKRDGSLIWIRSLNTTCAIAGVDAPVHIAMLIDITKEREMADALRMSEEQFRIAATAGSRAIARYDIKTGVYHHHDEVLLAMGFEEQISNVPQTFIDRGCIAPESVTEFLEYYEKLRSGEPSCSIEMKNLMDDGAYHWQRQDATVILDADGKPSQAILVMSDITESRQREAEYKERAETDPLTGVLNRASFSQAVDSIIAEPDLAGSLAILMLDIDAFKNVNDTLGHDMGDQVLRETADALRGILRQGDLLGRLGGDEFLICMREMKDDEAVRKKAEQICSLLHKSLPLDVQTSTSIGIALCPRDGKDFVTLYRKADTALYTVKASGKNNYAFFEKAMATMPVDPDE